jgi:hypothetical protein
MDMEPAANEELFLNTIHAGALRAFVVAAAYGGQPPPLSIDQ